MKIHKNRIISRNDDVFGHFILHTIALMGNKGFEIANPDIEEYDVSLTINGAEIPVEEVIMSWHDKLDNSVEYRSEQLFYEKFNDVGEIYSNLADEIRIMMNKAQLEICNKLNIEYNPIDL
jgi:hypothetical protein